MADFARYLPLSQRERRDERGVTNDWSGRLGAVLVRFADLVESLDDSAWSSPSCRPATTVGALVTDAIGELDEQGHGHDGSAIAAGPAEAAGHLRAIAVRVMASTRRTRVTALSTGVVAALDVAQSVGAALLLDPITTGAVAIARSVRAPVGIRAVLRERRLVATDAGWSVGSGRSIEATAASIVLFLFDRVGLPQSSPGPGSEAG